MPGACVPRSSRHLLGLVVLFVLASLTPRTCDSSSACTRTSEAFNRVFNQSEALPGGPGRDGIEKTVRDALENARQVPTSHLRGLVDAHVGPDKAFKTMQQFEALRVLPVEHLTDAQKAAMRSIRESIGGITAGTPVTKYIKFDTEFGAFNMLQNGKATMNGFVARTEDVAGLGNSRSVIDRLRLDTPNSAFADGLPTARIETVATPGMAASAKIPTNIDPAPAGWVRVNPDRVQTPFTGNGFTASLDGHLTPEMTLTTVETMMPNVTFMRLRQADGVTKYTYTHPITGQTASDWVLRMQLDLNGMPRYSWEPLLP